MSRPRAGSARGARRLGWTLVAAIAAALVLPSAAAAEHTRLVPGGLTATEQGAHFVVHYNPATTSAAYAAAGLADFEESYSHLVAGGGGAPNAGFAAPTPDSDGKTDVYLAAPTSDPGFSGGVVFSDSHPAGTRPDYVFMTPGLGRDGFRFRAGHEFFHVIQDVYIQDIDHVFIEGAANWAAEFALPDVEPLDNNFGGETGARPPPWVPLDCLSSWEGRSCGRGYGTWLFLQGMSEKYGPDFVTDYYSERFANAPFGLNQEIVERTAGNSNLARDFAEYARNVWDPTRWATTAVGAIHTAYGPPGSYTYDRGTPDSGTQNTSVDHLASRYLRVVNDGGFQPSGPTDAWRVTITRPAGLTADGDFLVDTAGSGALVNANWPGPITGSHTLAFGADPAQIAALIFPMVNDTHFGGVGGEVNDLGFSYRAEYLPGTPTPPASDTLAGALSAPLNGSIEIDTIYAGGRGADETPSTACDGNPAFADATRGVWLTLRTPSKGAYRFDASASDYPAVVSVSDPGGDGTTCGTSVSAAGDKVVRTYPAGRTLQVFVARRAGALGGRKARLAVTHTADPTKRKCRKAKKKKGRGRGAEAAAKKSCKRKKKRKRR